jgi:ATP-dependent Clp protease ATP-binding subunit ClpX
MRLLTSRPLACSFCRRSESEVAKLVAGPRVYICDRCVAIAVDLMKGDARPPVAAKPPSFKRRLKDWLHRHDTPPLRRAEA